MEIIKIADRKKWSDFLIANPGESGLEFLASPQWTDIIASEGKLILPLMAVNEAGDISALVCLIKEILPLGFFYWYAPRSPIFKVGISQVEMAKTMEAVVLKLKADYPKSVFLKIEPAQNFLQAGIKLVPVADIQPRKTLVLDLRKGEAELLLAMHQKTRYNIRLAKKKGVKITLGGLVDFPEFWRLMRATSERDGFRIHSQKHYQNLLVAPQNFIQLFFAEYEGQKIATALVCRFDAQATYLHGASDNKYRNVMAPYLLQWEIIKRAQADDALIYDFYGIDEKKWPGVTRFKLGFSGEERIYPGVFDIILRPVIYKLYQIFKKIKRIWR